MPLRFRAPPQSGLPAKAIDVWVAHELRRAGFEPDEVWPRATDPRVLPREIALPLARLPVTQRREIEHRLTPGLAGVWGNDARILGKNYPKQVHVVIAQWQRGPELLISTKRMDSSFGKNAFNRVEESYGDAKNLRGRHPLAALGFLFALRSTAFEREPMVAARIVDLLGKLGREDDAYDATALIVPEYDNALAPVSDEEEPQEADGDGPVTLPDAETGAAVQEDMETVVASLPTVQLRDDHVPPERRAHVFLQTLIEHVLDTTPVELHLEARRLRAAAGSG